MKTKKRMRYQVLSPQLLLNIFLLLLTTGVYCLPELAGWRYM